MSNYLKTVKNLGNGFVFCTDNDGDFWLSPPKGVTIFNEPGEPLLLTETEEEKALSEARFFIEHHEAAETEAKQWPQITDSVQRFNLSALAALNDLHCAARDAGNTALAEAAVAAEKHLTVFQAYADFPGENGVAEGEPLPWKAEARA